MFPHGSLKSDAKKKAKTKVNDSVLQTNFATTCKSYCSITKLKGEQLKM